MTDEELDLYWAEIAQVKNCLSYLFEENVA